MLKAKPQTSENPTLSSVQLAVLTAMRMLIGWHFLYEGIVKFTNPNWTAAAFLVEAKWLFADVFQAIAQNPTLLQIVDALNIYGLILIGLGLFFGAFTRIAAIAGMLLLALYYVANPPLIGLSSGAPTEGNYLFIDKNVIEFIGLLVVALFPTGTFFGIDGLVAALRKPKTLQRRPARNSGRSAPQTQPANSRRALLKGLATLPLFGVFVLAYLKKSGYESYEENNLAAGQGDRLDSQTGATIKTFQYSSLKDLKAPVPHAKIKDLELSRMILGGNLIGGWAHARDLIYVSKLVKSYHTEQKIFDTLQLAEQCGINALLTNPQLAGVINKYWRRHGGEIQFISDCGLRGDALEGAKRSIDLGAHSCYVQGEIADSWAKAGRFDDIAKTVEITRRAGLPAGIGAHKIETIKACVENGIQPDFWVKTLHHNRYWSADAEDQHDNIWCVKPEETVRFMESLEQPWIAFKVLAAGAIRPEVGFEFAFENGADFITVGMYDFQVVEDSNLVVDVLKSPFENRTRPWRA